jgi:anaerobic C4-dicarboxylate transporter
MTEPLSSRIATAASWVCAALAVGALAYAAYAAATGHYTDALIRALSATVIGIHTWSFRTMAETARLLAETRRIQEETARIREETARFRKETNRLRDRAKEAR